WHIDPSNYTIEGVAVRVRQFLFDELYAPLGLPAQPGVTFGFLVGGYSANAQTSELWGFTIQDGQCAAPTQLIALGASDAYAAGDPETFSRLVLGHSQKLAGALTSMGIPPADL